MYDRVYAGGAVIVASGLTIWWWALFPSTVASGVREPLPDASVYSVGDVRPAGTDIGGSRLDSSSPVRADLTQLVQTTGPWADANTDPWSTPAAGPPTGASPTLSDVVTRVPARPKLVALLTLLEREPDMQQRADLQERLRALLKLPDDALLQVLLHPDLAEFTKMLDAVFLGGTDLWWVEYQVSQITLVPITATTQRIDVSGQPAFVFDSTAAVPSNKGGPSSTGLKALPPRASDPQAPTMMMAAAVAPEAGVSTFAAPVLSPALSSTFSVSAPVTMVLAPVMETMQSVIPSSAPSSAPSPTPEPSTAEVSRASTEAQPTPSQDVIATGNKFEPGMKASEPATNNPGPSEDSTPSTQTSSPSANVDASATGNQSPSGGANEGGSNEGGASP